MRSTKALAEQLENDFPQIAFVCGDDFRWSAANNTLTYQPDGQGLFLLHELAHASLEHVDYQLDIDLIRQERDAWELTMTTLAPRYRLPVDEDLVQDALETYREWLYERSLCPACKQTGLQTQTSTYRCLNCRCLWRPNDARRCALRRYRLTD